MRCLVLLALAALAVLSFGQGIGKPPTSARSDDPHGIAALLEQLDDIRQLGVLWKLQLTDTQIDQLVAELEAVERRINEIQATEAKSLIALKNEIAVQRTQAVKGKTVPDSFFEKVARVFKDASKKRQDERLAAVKASSERIKKILNEKQYKDVLAESRQTLKSIGDSGADKATDNQAFWYYVEYALFSPRVTKLLREIAVNNPEPPDDPVK